MPPSSKAPCDVVTTVHHAVVRCVSPAPTLHPALAISKQQAPLVTPPPAPSQTLVHTPVHSSALIAPGPGVVEPSGHGVHPLGGAGPGPGPAAGSLSGSNTPLSAEKVPTGQLLLAAACLSRRPDGLGGPIGSREAGSAPGMDWGPGPGGFEVEDGVVLLDLGLRTALAAACAALTASSSSLMQVRQAKPWVASQAAGKHRRGRGQHSKRCGQYVSDWVAPQHCKAFHEVSGDALNLCCASDTMILLWHPS